MREKIAFWVSQRYVVPYRFRKSFVKRTCPKILSDYQFEINFYGMKYAGNTKDSTDRLFLMFGGCERYMLSFMKDYYMSVNKSDFVFLDVGAHVGNHSLFMSQYASKIYAFEPNPLVKKSFDEKINLNKIKNIIAYPFGLSNSAEKIPFYFSKKDDLSCGSFCKDHDKRNDSYEELNVFAGDDVMKEEKVENVDLIKIDVEGYEREAVEGLKKTIEKSRPAVIAEISVTTRKSFGSKNDFESIFPKDYCFYQFSGVSREKSSYKVTEFDYEQHKGHLDVIAIPKEKCWFLASKITKKLARNKVVGGDN